jgi:hypothetical protein
VTDKGTEENVESERETARGPSRSAHRDSRRNTSQRRQTPRTTRAQVARRRSGYTNEEIERGLHHVRGGPVLSPVKVAVTAQPAHVNDGGVTRRPLFRSRVSDP